MGNHYTFRDNINHWINGYMMHSSRSSWWDNAHLFCRLAIWGSFGLPKHPIHQPTHLTHFVNTLWLSSVPCLVHNWHSRKFHTITNSLQNYTCQVFTHPGNNKINYCITSSSVLGISHLSYWDKIIVQMETRTPILYPNASLSKPPLRNLVTQWQGS